MPKKEEKQRKHKHNFNNYVEMDAVANPSMSITENINTQNTLEFIPVKRVGSWEEGCEWIYVPRC